MPALPQKRIGISRAYPASMREGDLSFALTAGNPERLFHRFSGITHEYWAGEPLLADGSNKMRDGSVLNAYDVAISRSLTVTGVVDIIHTATETDDHALELDVDAAGFGDVKAIDISYVTGAIDVGQDEGIILLNIDESLATGGEVFGVEVLATEGSALIWGLKAAALVGPIHQDSGVFSNMDSALVNAADKLTQLTTSDPGGANNIAIFAADNDTVTIGHASKFEELEFLLETVASGGGIRPTFEFSDGASPTTWDTFTPVDGTNGMRNTGVIAWDDVDIPSWVVDGNSEYLIRITRTRNSLSTVPIENKVQIASTTTYTWDQNGDIYIRNLGRDADNLLDFATDNEITFRVGAADRGTWTTTGLGIENASPQELLHVGVGTDGSDITATDLLVTRAGPSNLSVRDSTNNVETFLFASSVGGIMGTVTDDPLNIQTNNTLAIFIDASQNIGIGTSLPLQLLALVKNADKDVGIRMDNSDEGVAALLSVSINPFGSNAFWKAYSDNHATKPALVEFGTTASVTELAFIVGSERARIDASGRVGFGVAPLTNMAAGDLVLEGGSLVLKEITTPTADTTYGKIYTKTDNKLYVQTGDGNEHEIAFV